MRIRQLGDPILRKVSLPVSDHLITSESVQVLLEEMKSILNSIKSISNENGNALSAPQVGRNIRVILLRIQGEFIPMINPELNYVSDKRFDFQEECFSFYHLRAVVSRHFQVDVTYQDEKGRLQKRVLIGEDAGLIQHEIDHLDGRLFLDRLNNDKTLESIDYQLREDPDRLDTVRRMIDYMTAKY